MRFQCKWCGEYESGLYIPILIEPYYCSKCQKAREIEILKEKQQEWKENRKERDELLRWGKLHESS